MDIWETIAERNILKNVEGANQESIISAEQKLGVSFSVEYKKLLTLVGACMFEGHEIIGICQYSGLDVVSKTTEERLRHTASPKWYVIEDAHIDSIVVWQDDTGIIYQTVPGEKPKKIAESLHQYLGFKE